VHTARHGRSERPTFGTGEAARLRYIAILTLAELALERFFPADAATVWRVTLLTVPGDSAGPRRALQLLSALNGT
jgi:hypothetical protein